jgi:formylglycine-generating enzyme required for sulfatase activity
MVEGSKLKTLVSVLILSVVGALALACASGSDIENAALSRSNTTADGKAIPYEISTSFKSIPGGILENKGLSINTNSAIYSSLLDEAVITYSENTQNFPELIENLPISISSFDMMETEVTVGMFVDFLNSLGGLIDATSSTSSTSTFSFSEPNALYRNAMASQIYCGIIKKEDGQTASIIITPEDLAGFYVANKPSQEKPLDPFITFQKARQMAEGTVTTFDVSPGRDHFPMVYVSQKDAKEFCAWLGINYRLPTLDEWMYAAKGGKSVDFATSTGDIYAKDINGNLDSTKLLANVQGLSGQPGSTKDLSKDSGETAGYTQPNGFGLRDMSGSVFEWTYYRSEDESGAPNAPLYREYMGGSYATTAFSGAAIWNRLKRGSEGVYAADLGFRVLYSRNRAQTIGR